jgi:hypothetical protein
MVISSMWPDIRLFLVSDIRPDIRKGKFGIRPEEPHQFSGAGAYKI